MGAAMTLWVPPRKIAFGWRNRIARAALAGAGWDDLDALKTNELEHTACSAGLDPEDLVLSATWDTPQWCRAVSVVNHNGSTDARGRLKVWSGDTLLWDTAAAPPDDAGDGWSWLAPGPPAAVAPFGDPRWWGLRPAPEDLEGYPPQWTVLLPVLEPWDRIELAFDDPTNPQGRFFIGSLWACPVLQLGRNFDRGAQVAWVDAGTVPGAEQGTPIGSDLLPPRSLRLTLSRLTLAEAWGGIFAMQKECGRTRPALVIPDPGAGQFAPHQTFLAFFRARGGVELHGLRAQATLDLIEWRL